MKRSRFEALEISIDGDEVARVLAAERGSYLPERKNSSSTLFSLVASTRVSMGSPIWRASCPANTLPKLPDGTAKETPNSGRWSAGMPLVTRSQAQKWYTDWAMRRPRLMELTVPSELAALNSRSPLSSLTRFWASSKTPSITMLCTLSSVSVYIWARWNLDMRPLGDSMNTPILGLDRNAYSAADPVSPEVAPRMFRVWSRCLSACGSASPRNCMAISLNARVGPWERSTRAAI